MSFFGLFDLFAKRELTPDDDVFARRTIATTCLVPHPSKSYCSCLRKIGHSLPHRNLDGDEWDEPGSLTEIEARTLAGLGRKSGEG